MKNGLKTLVFAILSVMLISCQKDTEFLITNGQVGKITKETKISKLDSLFPNDSIVKRYQPGNLKVASELFIYQKGGKKLLEIIPAKFSDDSQQISYVEILDERYKTAEGLSVKSPFGEFAKKYKISSIENMINNVMVSFESQDFYIVIDKAFLPADLKFDTTTKVSKAQIPDDAPLKYFSVSW
ncbi:MAG: hypothetical protein RQ735_01815 [Flavobacteriaceae bacterium]|nr:hypothetical protein [Flavobacteriaceae bacterium]